MESFKPLISLLQFSLIVGCPLPWTYSQAYSSDRSAFTEVKSASMRRKNHMNWGQAKRVHKSFSPGPVSKRPLPWYSHLLDRKHDLAQQLSNNLALRWNNTTKCPPERQASGPFDLNRKTGGSLWVEESRRKELTIARYQLARCMSQFQ
jgi:hypothetical protein